MKTYNLEIFSYGDLLYRIIGVTEEKLWENLKEYKEYIPTEFIVRALSFLEFGEILQGNYSIIKGKFGRRHPDNYRTIKITRQT